MIPFVNDRFLGDRGVYRGLITLAHKVHEVHKIPKYTATLTETLPGLNLRLLMALARNILAKASFLLYFEFSSNR